MLLVIILAFPRKYGISKSGSTAAWGLHLPYWESRRDIQVLYKYACNQLPLDLAFPSPTPSLAIRRISTQQLAMAVQHSVAEKPSVSQMEDVEHGKASYDIKHGDRALALIGDEHVLLTEEDVGSTARCTAFS